MDATTHAAAAAPIADDVVDAARPKADPELTTEVVAVSAKPVRRPDRRRAALLTAAGAVLVAGAVVAALVVPSDDPSGSADAAGAGTETAAITASPSPGATVGPLGATPTSTPGDLGTVGQGSGSSGAGGPGAGPQATGGPGSGSGSGEGSGNGSGSGSGEEPGADDPDDDPPAADPGPTPGRPVTLGLLGISITARCVGDQVEVLNPAEHRTGPQNRVTIGVSASIACRNGIPSLI